MVTPSQHGIPVLVVVIHRADGDSSHVRVTRLATEAEWDYCRSVLLRLSRLPAAAEDEAWPTLSVRAAAFHASTNWSR